MQQSHRFQSTNGARFARLYLFLLALPPLALLVYSALYFPFGLIIALILMLIVVAAMRSLMPHLRSKQQTLTVSDDRIILTIDGDVRETQWSAVHAVHFHEGSDRLAHIDVRGKERIIIGGFEEQARIRELVEAHVPEEANVTYYGNASVWAMTAPIVVGVVLVSLINRLLFIPVQETFLSILSLLLMLWVLIQLSTIDERNPRGLTILSSVLLLFGVVFLGQSAASSILGELEDNPCSITSASGLWESCEAVYEADDFALLNGGETLALERWGDVSIRPIDAPLWRPARTIDAHRFREIGNTPNGRHLITYSDETTLARWDTATWEQVATYPLPDQYQYVPERATWLNETVVVHNVFGNSTDLYNVATGETTTISETAELLNVSADGALFAIASRQEIDVHDAATLALTATFNAESRVLAAAFSPDGQTVAVCARNHIELFDLTGERVGSEYLWTPTDACEILYAADGRHLLVVRPLVAAGYSDLDDAILYEYEIEDDGDLRINWTRELDGVDQWLDMAFSADGDYLILSTYDRVYRLQYPLAQP